MTNFEEFGRRVDEEVEKLRQYIESQFKPNAERRTAEWLRAAARKLADAAAEIERRSAAKDASTAASDSPPASNSPKGPA